MALEGNPSPSNALALLAFIFAVPAGLALAYYGHVRGYYPYGAIPFVLGGLIVLVTVVLLVVLPRLSERERLV